MEQVKPTLVYQLLHYDGDRLDESLGLFSTSGKARLVAEYFTPNVLWEQDMGVNVGKWGSGKHRWEISAQRIDWMPDGLVEREPG